MPAGLPGASFLRCSPVGGSGPSGVSPRSDTGSPTAGGRGAVPHSPSRVTKQGGRTRESPHVWFSGGFTRPTGTSTRDYPYGFDHVEACRPQGLCTSLSVVAARASSLSV